MAKSSHKQRSAKSGQQAPAPKSTGASSKPTGPAPSSAKGKAAGAPKGKAPVKKRGTWLTVALAIVTLGAIVSAVLPFYYRKSEIQITNPWLVTGAIVVGLLGLAGVFLMWRWKRLGIYLFLASVAGSIAVGMFVYPSMLAAFHALVPLLFLGGAMSVDRQLPLFD